MVITAAQATAFFTAADQMALPAATYNPALQNEGITTIDDLKEFDDKMLDQIHKHISQNGVAGQTFSALSLSRLNTAASAVQYYQDTDRPLSAGCMKWTPTLTHYKAEMEALKVASKRDDPPVSCISKALPLMKWLQSFKSYIFECFGARGFPLGYVLRENAAVSAVPALATDRPYSTEHGSVM
ncbi:MAG: hypothetical protein SGBAC_010478, partial [Bacillariaceae sp.]